MCVAGVREERVLAVDNSLGENVLALLDIQPSSHRILLW